MNLEFYKNFIAIVEAGGLNKASRQIHVAQPALTRQLQLMEKEYGAALVDPRRGRHSLKLTEAGWIFYRQAKQIYETDQTTHAEIEALTAGLTGTLRISVFPSYAPFLFQKIIPQFHEKYPDLCFRIRESYHTTLVDDIRTGVSEIGIANAPLTDPSFFKILRKEECQIMIAGPKGSPLLEENETITPDMLAGQPLAVSRSTEEIIKKLFRSHNIVPRILFSVDTRSSAMDAAESKMAFGIVVRDEGDIYPTETLTFRPLAMPDVPIGKTFFCQKGHRLSKAMEEFLAAFPETAEIEE